jgi:hypothetical protein
MHSPLALIGSLKAAAPPDEIFNITHPVGLKQDYLIKAMVSPGILFFCYGRRTKDELE